MLDKTKTITRFSWQKPISVASILVMSQVLSGCIFAMQPAYQVASLLLDGVSYVSTGKSVSDHALSAVAQKDCAVLRALNGRNICETQNTLAEVQDIDETLADPNTWSVTTSDTVVSYAQQPVWQPYTPRQQALSAINGIDQIVAQGQ